MLIDDLKAKLSLSPVDLSYRQQDEAVNKLKSLLVGLDIQEALTADRNTRSETKASASGEAGDGRYRGFAPFHGRTNTLSTVLASMPELRDVLAPFIQAQDKRYR